MFSEEKAHNSVPLVLCRILFGISDELFSLSGVTALVGAVQSGKCEPGLLPNGAGPPCHFSHLSWPALANISENDCFCPKSGRVLKQTVVELCATMGVDKGMCTSLYFLFKNFIPCPKVQ